MGCGGSKPESVDEKRERLIKEAKAAAAVSVCSEKRLSRDAVVTDACARSRPPSLSRSRSQKKAREKEAAAEAIKSEQIDMRITKRKSMTNRRAAVRAVEEQYNPDEDKSVIAEKLPEEIDEIRNGLLKSDLFGSLTTESIDFLIRSFTSRTVTKEEVRAMHLRARRAHCHATL